MKTDCRILIIEDEEDIASIMTQVLKDEGYHITTATDGVDGLEKLRRDKPHLIILDMNMPRMTGMEFYHTIYDSEKEKPKCPVLAVTARADLKELFLELNVEGYLTKPFEIDRLAAEVNVIFKKLYGLLPEKKEEVISASREEKREMHHRVLLVDRDARLFGTVVTYFLNYGFDVLHADSAAHAIETLMVKGVDAVLISLHLEDMGSDVLVYRLKRMPKTMDIPIILYGEFDQGASVTQKILEKTGLELPFIIKDPARLFEECKKIFK